MSDFTHKDGFGNLRANKFKKAENHPDYIGTGRVHGEEIEVSGWKKVDKNGEAYVSLSFKPKYVKDGKKPAPKDAAPLPDDELLPF